MDYIEMNKKLWNAKTPVHLESEFYNHQEFLKGKSSLHNIELELLGDVKGKSIMHLQCHFGQDSISMARMGAQVSALDLSDEAIKAGRDTAKQMNVDVDFHCCDIYESPKKIDKKYDIVYASYGTIGWLPDMDKWAGVVDHFLKPGGKLVFVEFHPIIYMYDDALKNIAYSYFNVEPIVEEETGTYANKSSELKTTYCFWNHNLAEVIGSLLKKGLQLDDFQEYDHSPYNVFEDGVEKDGWYYVKGIEGKFPLVYSLVVSKPS